MPPVFLNNDDPIPGLDGSTVGHFWQWAYSDILSDRNRSIFAEFIVGVALGVLDTPRVEWDAVDLRFRGYSVEVKAAAYLQSWTQKKLSAIRYDFRKKRPDIAAEMSESTGEATRRADVYVFCHYAETEKARANVLDLPTWDFYVVSKATLTREFDHKQSLSLLDVKRVGTACKFDCLRAEVEHVIG